MPQLGIEPGAFLFFAGAYCFLLHYGSYFVRDKINVSQDTCADIAQRYTILFLSRMRVRRNGVTRPSSVVRINMRRVARMKQLT